MLTSTSGTLDAGVTHPPARERSRQQILAKNQLSDSMQQVVREEVKEADRRSTGGGARAALSRTRWHDERGRNPLPLLLLSAVISVCVVTGYPHGPRTQLTS